MESGGGTKMRNSLKIILKYLNTIGRKAGFHEHNSQNWREFLEQERKSGHMDGDWKTVLWQKAFSEPELCMFAYLHKHNPTMKIEDLRYLVEIYSRHVQFLWKWRDAKIVYKFDKELENALLHDTHFSIDDDIPADILTNLPHRSFFIDTENAPVSEETKKKFIKGMNESEDAFSPERFMGIFVNLYDYYDREGNALPTGGHLQISLLLSEPQPGDIPYNVVSTCITIPPDKSISIKDAMNMMDEDEKYRDAAAGIALNVLQYLLYLCAENSVVRPLGKEPRKPRLKKYTEAKEPSKYAVNFPKELHRKFPPTERGVSAVRVASPEGEKRTTAPHERRAHWHSYWTGGRKGSEKAKLALRWLSPILVNYGKGETVGTNVTVK